MEIHYIKNEWKGLRFFLQMCRPITIWNHRIFLSGVPVVSKNGAACLQRGRNRRFRRKEWAVAETAARSYDRTAVSPCFLTIDCISRMRHAPNRIFLHFQEKKKALQMFYLQGFSLFLSWCLAVRRGLELPTHCFDFQGPFCEAHFGTPNWPLPVCVVFHNPFGLFSETEVWKFLLMCKNSKNNSNPVITYRADSWRRWNILLPKLKLTKRVFH